MSEFFSSYPFTPSLSKGCLIIPNATPRQARCEQIEIRLLNTGIGIKLGDYIKKGDGISTIPFSISLFNRI
jgi:hypothetical protein